MQLLLFNVYLYICVSVVNSAFCFWNSGCPYKQFSSKTPYSLVRGDIRDSAIQVKDCKAVSIWSLYTHGKTYPSKHYANHMREAFTIRDRIAESFEKRKCSLCAQDVENLMKWSVDNKMFKGVKVLTEEGYQEMYGVAKRLKIAFPNLLANIKQGEYMIGPTTGEMIEDSANAFIDGIGDRQLVIDKAVNDAITPYASCGKYESEVKSNPKTYEEAAKYQRSTEYLAMKDRIQRRTGIDIKLTDDNVTALYDLCRYPWSGIENKPSPWCALFTSEDLQILEYVEDLNQFYRNGYGTPMNELFGRIILVDLLKTFREVQTGKGKKITAYFSRSTVIDMALSALGLFKDKDLLNGSKRNRDRKWRSYKQSTFSSNIMAVLSRCNKNEEDDYTVVFYLNEEPIRSICDEGICPWKEFENKIKSFAETNMNFCDFNAIR